MINRINFKNSLYKLILLKNIIETKVYKEKMAVLFAFEQMIINTEEAQEDEIEYKEESADEEDLMKDQIMKLTNVSSSTSAYILKALLKA